MEKTSLRSVRQLRALMGGRGVILEQEKLRINKQTWENKGTLTVNDQTDTFLLSNTFWMDGWIMVESSDKMWSIGERNGKPIFLP